MDEKKERAELLYDAINSNIDLVEGLTDFDEDLDNDIYDALIQTMAYRISASYDNEKDAQEILWELIIPQLKECLKGKFTCNECKEKQEVKK